MPPVQRLFTIMTKPWVAMTYLGLVLLSFLYVDKPLALLIQPHSLSANYPWLGFLTVVGEGKFYLVTLLLIALVFRYLVHHRLWELRIWFLWLCVLIPNLICLVLKVFLGRARPELWFSDQVYGFYGFHRDSSYWSFPSGHTTTIMGFVCGLSFLFPRHAWLYLAIGCAVVASRILLLQHYLSDVMIAADLALLEVGVLWFISCRKACFSRPLVA